jgi:hypothetical protein
VPAPRCSCIAQCLGRVSTRAPSPTLVPLPYPSPSHARLTRSPHLLIPLFVLSPALHSHVPDSVQPPSFPSIFFGRFFFAAERLTGWVRTRHVCVCVVLVHGVHGGIGALCGWAYAGRSVQERGRASGIGWWHGVSEGCRRSPGCRQRKEGPTHPQLLVCCACVAVVLPSLGMRKSLLRCCPAQRLVMLSPPTARPSMVIA